MRSTPDDDLLKRFGATIRARRESVGLSQEQLAVRAGLDRSYVGGVERGERNVSLKNLTKLAGGLDVSLAELFADVEGPR